ncbi:glycosyltransferase family 2 protein [Paracoccus benzoatiresistens]|uniref:Glycosyltransferase family 2 protein n=1 Tax=Paracoccus benzoatiresistens TaxID=2997341 RepID=A0ABT4JCI4_9RHOB|nr:glycosyltransferase family 2 protein [Paracoccus sp. EF6]MCZ0964445.1 glycosyltransferase family 2 protein [Paracoccus sp. EF6]
MGALDLFRKIKACAICMQKNEGRLLQAWTLHHSNIFDAENVYILDNQSDDHNTKSVLEWAESCGVNVLRGFDNFEFKGIEVSNLIQKINGQYDWFLPLDADEFVGVYKSGLFSMDRQDILHELRFSDPSKIIRMSNYVWSIPNSLMGYYTEARKTVIPRDLNIRLDIGFHLYSWDPACPGDTVASELFQKSSLCFAHIHNKPYDELIRSAKLKLEKRVASFDRETLVNYKGAGNHLIKYFLMTRDEYESSFPQGKIPLGKAFFDAGLSLPFSLAS